MLRLKRNYGQTTALAAGFDYASGDVIISMDGDLQHDPADIPALLETLDATGCDIVSGWRQKRVDNFILRRLPSRVANWMMAKLSGVTIHDFGTTFKVYRRETIKDIPLYGEMHRFIPALAAWNGAKIVEVPIRNVRAAGRPVALRHFTDAARFLRHHHDSIPDAIHDAPAAFLRTAGFVGIVFWRRDHGVPAVEKLLWRQLDLFVLHGPLLILGMMLTLFGVQLLAVGLIGELLMRIILNPRANPIYRVEHVYGGAETADISAYPKAKTLASRQAGR